MGSAAEQQPTGGHGGGGSGRATASGGAGGGGWNEPGGKAELLQGCASLLIITAILFSGVVYLIGLGVKPLEVQLAAMDNKLDVINKKLGDTVYQLGESITRVEAKLEGHWCIAGSCNKRHGCVDLAGG